MIWEFGESVSFIFGGLMEKNADADFLRDFFPEPSDQGRSGNLRGSVDRRKPDPAGEHITEKWFRFRTMHKMQMSRERLA